MTPPTEPPSIAGGNPLLPILHAAVRAQAADLHLKAHMPPRVMLDGRISELPGFEQPLDPVLLPQMIFALLAPEEAEHFRQHLELDTSFELPGLARFRLNVFLNLGTVAAVIRIVPPGVRSFDSLGLPPVLRRVLLEKSGLILVTGATGSGKSTTLAAMIDFINDTLPGHIVTIEDPVEVVHPHKACVISQREVGKDTLGFAPALRAALRQAPNVILLGEMRDRETIELAIRGAETGHLVLATLHTSDAVQSIHRLLHVFNPNEHSAVLAALATVLKASIAQRLIPRIDGKGRLPVFDVLIQTPTVQDAIRRGQLDELYQLVEQGTVDGMQSTNQGLRDAFTAGMIDFAASLAASENKQGLVMALRQELRAIKEAAEALAGHGRPAPAPANRAGEPRDLENDYIKVIKVHQPGASPPRGPR